MKEAVKPSFLETDQKELGLNIQTHTYLPESVLCKPDMQGSVLSSERNVNNSTASGVCPGTGAI